MDLAKIVEVKHPLVKHKLGLMREQDISTNDAFRAVSKYWDRITRPEQLMSACINVVVMLVIGFIKPRASIWPTPK